MFLPIIAVALVSSPTAAAAVDASPACSRERSRHARAVLDDFFHPLVEDNAYDLPSTCPFDRSKDMYLEHERHKEVVRRTQFRSLYSDKVFKSEYYVDKHMDNRHMDKIPPGADVCLADYCDVLRCDEHREWRQMDGRGRGRRKQAIERVFGRSCDREKLRGARHFCEVVMRRCFPTGGAVDDTLPVSAGVAARLGEHFTRHHCDALTCEDVSRMFERMSGHRPESGGGAMVALVLVLALLTAFYATLYSYGRTGAKSRGDLRRARKETAWTRVKAAVTRASRTWPLTVLFGKRRKHKVY